MCVVMFVVGLYLAFIVVSWFLCVVYGEGGGSKCLGGVGIVIWYCVRLEGFEEVEWLGEK